METRLAVKLVWQGNSLFVNVIKTVIFILVVKHIACNAKVDEIILFRDFLKSNYTGNGNK